jgi:hypothetical protein
MMNRRRSKINPFVPLIIGIVATLCAYLALYVIGKMMCDMNTVAVKNAVKCSIEIPSFVMKLPLFFVAIGLISTLGRLFLRRDKLN